jgi:phenylacetate-CoA ligase
MPFIRYTIGDMGVYETSTCTCGRGLPVLREVVGRVEDFLVDAEGEFMYGGIFDNVIQTRPEIVRYQVYQPDRRHVEVRLVCNREVDQVWLEGVRGELQSHFGAPMQISLQVVDRIPLTSAGKHRFVVSEVRPDFLHT